MKKSPLNGGDFFVVRKRRSAASAKKAFIRKAVGSDEKKRSRTETVMESRMRRLPANLFSEQRRTCRRRTFRTDCISDSNMPSMSNIRCFAEGRSRKDTSNIYSIYFPWNQLPFPKPPFRNSKIMSFRNMPCSKKNGRKEIQRLQERAFRNDVG